MNFLRPLLDRFASPLLMGLVTGIVVVAWLWNERLESARDEDRSRVDAMGRVLIDQNKGAERERKLMELGIVRHHRWAESKWVELDSRLGRIEAGLGIDRDEPATTPE